MTALPTLQKFIGHIFNQEMDAALSMVAPEAIFALIRQEPDPEIPLYGRYTGVAGAQAFFGAFATLLKPGEFNIEAAFEDGEHVAMYGSFRHSSRKTGRDFASDWAMIARVKAGKVTLYRMYEDTAALEAAVK